MEYLDRTTYFFFPNPLLENGKIYEETVNNTFISVMSIDVQRVCFEMEMASLDHRSCKTTNEGYRAMQLKKEN